MSPIPCGPACLYSATVRDSPCALLVPQTLQPCSRRCVMDSLRCGLGQKWFDLADFMVVPGPCACPASEVRSDGPQAEPLEPAGAEAVRVLPISIVLDGSSATPTDAAPARRLSALGTTASSPTVPRRTRNARSSSRAMSPACAGSASTFNQPHPHHVSGGSHP